MLSETRLRVVVLAFVMLIAVGGVTWPIVSALDTGSKETTTVPMNADVATQNDLLDINITDDYNGIKGGSQAVSVTVTFTASGPVSGLRIAVRETDKAFIDYDSFERVEGSGVTVESVQGREGVFRVPELEKGQMFSLRFRLYPRRLDQAQLRGASIRLTADNPQTYEQFVDVQADLSSSPLLQYQTCVESCPSDGGGPSIPILGIGGVIVLLVGGAIGTGLYRSRIVPDKIESAKDDEESEILEELDALKDDMDPASAQELQAYIDERGGSGPDISVD